MVRIVERPKKGLSFDMNFYQLLAVLFVFGIVFALPSYIHARINSPEGNVAGVYTESFVEAREDFIEIRQNFDWGESWQILNTKQLTPAQAIIIAVSSVSFALLLSSLIRYYKVMKLLGVEG
jgi:hypothetical protein